MFDMMLLCIFWFSLPLPPIKESSLFYKSQEHVTSQDNAVAASTKQSAMEDSGKIQIETVLVNTNQVGDYSILAANILSFLIFLRSLTWFNLNNPTNDSPLTSAGWIIIIFNLS